MSEMPQETEEEEEINEEIRIDGLDDDDDSDSVLEEDEVREVLASAWKQKRQEISKERLRRGFEKPSKSAATPATRKFRAEVKKLKLKTNLTEVTVWDTRQENVHKHPHKVTREAEGETNLGRKTSTLSRRQREMRIFATGVLETNHVFSVSSSADTAPCWKGFADAANNVVRCWIKQRN